MSTSNMLWNMVKPNSKALYFFGCMTVACAKLSAAGSLATAGGLSATNIPIGEELLEPTTGGRLRHGHRLNRAGRRPRLHTCWCQALLSSFLSWEIYLVTDWTM